MSEILNIFPSIADKQYFQNSETKEFWFHATAVCNELGFKNPGRTLDMYCDDDEKFQEVLNGRVVWFVSEAGCYGLAMAAKTEASKKFKRWLKHDVLPKLRASGGYIMPTATSEQIQALRQELDQRDAYIDHQEKTIDYLVDCKHVKEIVYQFAMNNIEYTPDKKYIASGTLWDMWVDWSDKHYHRRGRKLIKIYQEDFRKYMRELFPKTDKRFYVDPKNGYADVEHARVKPTIDPFGE